MDKCAHQDYWYESGVQRAKFCGLEAGYVVEGGNTRSRFCALHAQQAIMAGARLVDWIGGTGETPPAFDVEEYRADLTRRIESLGRLAEEAYAMGHRNRWREIESKSQGLQIALDLLPRAES